WLSGAIARKRLEQRGVKPDVRRHLQEIRRLLLLPADVPSGGVQLLHRGEGERRDRRAEQHGNQQKEQWTAPARRRPGLGQAIVVVALGDKRTEIGENLRVVNHRCLPACWRDT